MLLLLVLSYNYWWITIKCYLGNQYIGLKTTEVTRLWRHQCFIISLVKLILKYGYWKWTNYKSLFCELLSETPSCHLYDYDFESLWINYKSQFLWALIRTSAMSYLYDYEPITAVTQRKVALTIAQKVTTSSS